MTYVNEQGYVERKTRSGKNCAAGASKRNWWIVKSNGLVWFGNVSLRKYFGQKVRFKIEVIKD